MQDALPPPPRSPAVPAPRLTLTQVIRACRSGAEVIAELRARQAILGSTWGLDLAFLDLTWSILAPGDLASILQHLKDPGTLRHLSLFGLELRSRRDLAALARWLQGSGARSLSLWLCAVEGGMLGKLLHQARMLESLSLACCALGDRGLGEVVTLLPPCVRRLEVTSMDITEALQPGGARPCAPAGLRELSLVRSAVGAVGVPGLLALVRQCPSLERLDLVESGLDGPAVRALLAELPESVRRLDLHGNPGTQGLPVAALIQTVVEARCQPLVVLTDQGV